MENNYYCYGCGYILQDKKISELGYIKNINSEKEVLYCKRCHDMIFKNIAPETFLKEEDYLELFKYIVSKKQLYVLIIDIFNIEGSLNSNIIKLLKDRDILVVLNKRDLLPKLVKDNKIYASIKNHPKLKNLNILDYVVVSSKKKYNIDYMLEKINKLRSGDVYLIGVANVGKSSLLNALINSVTQDNKTYVSTSYYAGTTLGMISVPLDEEHNLIDTPGIINVEDVTSKLKKSSLELVVPKKEIRPKTFQLNEEQSLFISGLVQVDYIKGTRQGFTIYASNNIEIHRTKLENANLFRQKNLGINILIPPTKEEIKSLDFKEEEVNLQGKNVDLVINGICWINFKNIDENLSFKLTIPSEVTYYIRKGLI